VDAVKNAGRFRASFLLEAALVTFFEVAVAFFVLRPPPVFFRIFFAAAAVRGFLSSFVAALNFDFCFGICATPALTSPLKHKNIEHKDESY
jgi:hypothetical protein